MNTHLGALCAGICILGAGPSVAASFDILTDFDFGNSGLDRREQAQVKTTIGRAVDFWTTNVTGYAVDDANLVGINVPVRFGSFGPSIIAFVSDRATYPNPASNGTNYSETQPFTINTEFLPLLAANPRIAFNVAIHELAHTIGFGLRWVDNGVYVNGSGQYLGANGLAAYRAEFDPLALYVPVEIETGLPGSDNFHWAETWAGGPLATMTSFIDHGPMVTDTTLLSFRDLGYTTLDSVQPTAVPVPALSPVMLVAFLSLLLLGPRRGRENT
ncbi:MAG: hypothetical protein AAGB18_01795 [Pseudomonadota bacterium]